MRRCVAMLCLLAFVLGGCRHAEEETRPTPRETFGGSGGSASSLSPTQERESTPDPEGIAKATSKDDRGVVHDTLWKSASFQKQLTESYLSDSDVEPRLNEDDREKLAEVFRLMNEEKIDEALALTEKHRGDLASAAFDFTLGNLCTQKDRPEEAASAYEIAVAKFPKFRRAWNQLGMTCVRSGNFERALPALTKVVELGGGDALTFGLLGHAYSKVGNDLAAESAFRMAILRDPQKVDWKIGLARSFFKQERYPEAVALFGNMLAAEPDRADLWIAQGEAYLSMGQPLRAAEVFEVADRLGGGTAEILNTLGDIYANQELYDMAVAAYARGIQKDPAAKPDRFLRSARFLSGRGAVAEAKLLVEKVESLMTSQLDAESKKELLRIKARIALAQGATQEEADILKQIIDIDPLDGDALILLGLHAGRTGEADRAVLFFERAAGIEAFEADAKLRHGELLVRLAKYQEALPLLRRAQVLKPRNNVQQYLEQVERVAQGR